MIAFIVLFSFIAIVYAYFGYPLLLWLLTKYGANAAKMSANAEQDQNQLSLSVVIAAKNEEGVIREKIENTLAAVEGYRAQGGVVKEIIVASDKSTDSTDEIVRSFAEQGIILAVNETEPGKEFAQKHALLKASGSVVFFTDAKVMLDQEAICNLMHYFEDASVGAVSSLDRVEGEVKGSSGEGMYVRYEMLLRRLESKYGSLVGLSGSGFAVRRSVADQIRTDVPSDFGLLLASQRQGLRGVHAEDVIVRYRAVKTEEEEFARKVRTVLRGMTTLWACREVLNFKVYGSFSWQVASHKLMRWLVPLFFVVATLGSVFLVGSSLFFSLIFLGGLGICALALLAYRQESLRSYLIFKIPLFFVITNCAIAMAWLKLLKGEKTVQWDPSQKTKG